MIYLKKYGNQIKMVLITLAFGVLGSLLSGNFGVYASLEKPAFSPPAILFPIVWTVLYILMGIAAGIVLDTNDMDKGQAIKLYILQLSVNVIWPLIFFRFKAAKFALFWLTLLIITVFATYKSFRSVSKTAGNLLIPYMLWLIVAFYLNFGVIVLNS